MSHEIGTTFINKQFFRYDEFVAFRESSAELLQCVHQFEASLMIGEIFHLRGMCNVCARQVLFHIDYEYALETPSGAKWPNFRERVICPYCELNTRMRLVVAEMLSRSSTRSAIYLTEALTPLFRIMKAKRPNALGSEFLRDGTPNGKSNKDGVRREDVTALTFPDRSFDVVGTFDVLEHVPDYRAAQRELYRIIKPGGSLVLTVPIDCGNRDSVKRAEISPTGDVVHLLPPEIHGDPLDTAGGVLAFYNFGWDFMDGLSEAGFSNVAVSVCWSPAGGIIGGLQPMILAEKPRAGFRFPQFMRRSTAIPRISTRNADQRQDFGPPQS